VGLEGEAVLGEEGACTLLVESSAVELLCGGGAGSGGLADASGSRSVGQWNSRSRFNGGAREQSRSASQIRQMKELPNAAETYAGSGLFASSSMAGAALDGPEGGSVEEPGLSLVDFSRLKTLLMRLTYLPKLLRRSPSFASFASGGGAASGVDMATMYRFGGMAGEKETVVGMVWWRGA